MAALIWSTLMGSTVYIMQTHRNQKLMYNSFISVSTQVCKWGGTNTSVYRANGKSFDIAGNMMSQINNLPGRKGNVVSITASPQVVKEASDKIYVEMRWKDLNFMFFPEKEHILKGEFTSITKPGSLVKKGG